MAHELNYRLGNPNFTIYHRAALGGLAATIRAWGANKPDGIDAEITRDSVRLAWGDDITDQEALRRILAASFKLTEDKLIDLPGQGIRAGQDDLRLAIHSGIMGTFLDHPSSYKAEKQKGRFVLRTADDDEGTGSIYTYKALTEYAHQEAIKRLEMFDKKGNQSKAIAITKWVVPGAFTGASPIGASFDEAVLLLYLIVGCGIFLLRPRTFKEKAQTCVVIPDVIDLLVFARALIFIANKNHSVKRVSGGLLDRIVSGAEEAALRFSIDLKAEDITSERSIKGCLAVAMGKVAWDKKQNNRSFTIKVKGDYDEIGIFLAANEHLSNPRIIKLESGECFAKQDSLIPELVAANLAAERHWCAHFKPLVSDKKDFERMRFAQGGLKAMKEAIKDADDQAIIRVFQEAWRLTMGEFGERARRGEFIFERKVETEREKMRNAILRTKTADALAGWFLRFCADATKGGSLGAMRTDANRIREFIFNPRNFDRFQNLCLFALVSYASDEAKTATGGNK